jgi:hypothetical protein
VVSKVVDDEDRKPRGSLISYGRICLDFLQATRGLSVGDQGSRQDLSRWIFERGLTERPVPVSTPLLPEVTALREAIRVCVRAAMAQGEFPGSQRDRINRWAMVHACTAAASCSRACGFARTVPVRACCELADCLGAKDSAGIHEARVSRIASTPAIGPSRGRSGR